MKSKFTKVLGVVVVLATLASLVVGFTAAPVSAAVGTMDFGSVSTPSNVGFVIGGWDLDLLGVPPAPHMTGTPNADLIGSSADGKTVFVWDNTLEQMYKSTNSGVSFGTPINFNIAGPALDMKVSPNFATDNAAMMITATEAWLTTNGGTSWVSVAVTDLAAKLEGGTITSMDIGNYYATNSLNLLVGATGGAGLISNVLRFNMGDFSWTEVGAASVVFTPARNNGFMTTAGVGGTLTDPSVVAVKFSPNHLGDAEILAVYTNGTDTFLSSRYANLGFAAITPDLKIKAAAVPTSARIAMASDYAGNTSAPLLVGLAGTGAVLADDIYRVTSRGAGAGASLDLDIGGTGANTTIRQLAIGGPAASAGILWSIAGSSTLGMATGLVGTFTIGTLKKQPTGSTGAYPLWTSATTAIVATTGVDGAVSVSADSGASWNQTALMNVGVAGATGIAAMSLKDITVVDANTIFLVMANGNAVGAATNIFKTTDGGTTWMRISTSAALATAIDLVTSPAYATDSTLIVVDGTTTVMKSVNGGASFTSLFQPAPVEQAIMVDANTFYTGALNGFYKGGRFTNATGLTTSGDVFSIAMNPKDATKLTFAIGTTSVTASVYETKDGGVSFARVGTAAVAATDNIFVTYGTDGTLYAAGDKTTTGGIFKWTGTAWLALGVTPAARGLIVTTDGTLYAPDMTVDGGVYRSLTPAAVTSVGLADPNFEQMRTINFPGFKATYTLSDIGVVSTATDNTVYVIENTTAAGTTVGYAGRVYGIKDTFTVGPKITAPAAAALLTTDVKATVTWSGVTGAPVSANAAPNTNANTVYAADVNTTSAFNGTAITVPALNADGISVNLTGLTAGTTYFVRARATSPVKSRYATTVSFTTALSAIAAPLTATVPLLGAVDVSVDGTFSWPSITGATGYNVAIAEETGQTDKFAILDYSATTPTNAFKLREKLKYNTQYWWRVQPFSATTTGAWTTFFFTTEKAPVAATTAAPTTQAPPIIVTQVPPPEITLQIPPGPAPVQVIPSYLLWAVIGVGAILVIAVIVLIVRTRRVS